MQAELNIGVLGHVDHGKTTLVRALTGKWTDTHSEELKRGISIRLGYADMNVYQCERCGAYSNKDTCLVCGGPATFKRRVSFVDAPGHETLMATTIAGSSIIDGVLFIVAADEKCPQPQTKEHFAIIEALNIKNIVIVQTKIDLVSKERAKQSLEEIKAFVKGTVAEDAPIIPVVATHGINIHYLLQAIEQYIPTPQRDESKDPIMYISRSFDVNKPGTPISHLQGGVVGGSIKDGVIKLGDVLELRPGVEWKGKLESVSFEVTSLRAEKDVLTEAKPGGLIAVGTTLDPALTKADSLIGNVIGKPGALPEVLTELDVEYEILPIRKDEVKGFVKNEPVVLNVHTATTVGFITDVKGSVFRVELKRPVAVEKGSAVAISKRIGQRWKLSAWGKVK